MKKIGGGTPLPQADDESSGMPSEVYNQLTGDVYGTAILVRDVRGGIHVHQDQPTLPKPSQLPPAVHLSGRSHDLAALDAARSQSPTVIISGPPGIGKTALAVQWGHARREAFPDGQLFADLRGHASDGPAGPGEILGRFLRALGVAPQSLPAELGELTALYRSVTSDRRVAVVLDDAISAAQVRPLLPTSAESTALITSRWRLASLVTEGARCLQLDRLDPSAAVDLLRHLLGAERVSAELTVAEELAFLCSYFPLTLCISAARLAVRSKWRISELVEMLRSEQSRLSAFAVDDEITLRVSLDLSYRALPAQAARIYRLMGLIPGGPFDSQITAAAASLPVSEAKRLLCVLADANLLDDAAGGRYRFHDLVRLHARTMAEEEDSETARNTAIGQTLDWYLDAVTRAGRAVTPYRHGPGRGSQDIASEPLPLPSDGDALDWLEQELPNLTAATRYAADHGHPALAWRIVDGLWPLFLRRGLYPERLALDRIGLAAARRAGDGAGEAKMLGRYSLVLIRLGRLDEAAQCARQALSIWRAAGDHHRVAGSLRRLALVEQARGRPDEALALFAQALAAYERLGESRKTGLILTDIGAVLIDARRAGEAVGYLRRAHQVLDDTADPYNRARALAILGQALISTGELAEASAALEPALHAMRAVQSLTGEAQVLGSLGELAEASEQPETARQRYEAAQEILRRIGSPRAPEVAERLSRLTGEA